MPDRERSTCPWCAADGTMFISVITVLVAQPIGTWSVAGQQAKTVAKEQNRPVLVCRACRTESVGWIDGPGSVDFHPEDYRSEISEDTLADRESRVLKEV